MLMKSSEVLSKDNLVKSLINQMKKSNDGAL